MKYKKGNFQGDYYICHRDDTTKLSKEIWLKAKDLQNQKR